MIAGLYDYFQRWSQNTVWIYSDPHFGDKELAKGISNRPTDEEQIKMINSCVGRNDTFICLGDVGDISYIQKIRGYKVLICGNHDVGHTKYKREIKHKRFDVDKYSRLEAIDEMRKLYPNCKYTAYKGYELTHAPFVFWEVVADNQLFDEVYSGPLIIGEKLILSHEPINIPYLFNIHGHVHTKHNDERTYSLNVCSDAIGYKPMNLNRLMKEGLTSNIENIHRLTIDKATEKRKKKNGEI